MTRLSRALRWFNDMASNPPSWMRWAYVPISALVAVAAMQQRGWLFGTVAAVMFVGGGLAMALNPGGVINWSRDHPKSDGAILGPLLFFALAVVTSLSLWWCLLGGMLGAVLGIAMGERRGRLLLAGPVR